MRTSQEARSRDIEKKPPMAAISLDTDVDAPRGEKKMKLQENTNNRSCGWGAQPPAVGGC